MGLTFVGLFYSSYSEVVGVSFRALNCSWGLHGGGLVALWRPALSTLVLQAFFAALGGSIWERRQCEDVESGPHADGLFKSRLVPSSAVPYTLRNRMFVFGVGSGGYVTMLLT